MQALTPRELEVALLVSQGRSNRDIAGTLEISVCTTKNHLQRVFKKLRVANRTQLALLLTRAAA